MRDLREVKSGLLPWLTLGGAVHKISQATGIGQGTRRTKKKPKGAERSYSLEKEERMTHRETPGKAAEEAAEEASSGLGKPSHLLQPLKGTSLISCCETIPLCFCIWEWLRPQ